jgi:type IV protein arginine methyltransferase
MHDERSGSFFTSYHYPAVHFERVCYTMSDSDNSDAEPMNDAQIEEIVDFGQQLIDKILDRRPFEAIKAEIEAGAPLWFQDGEGTSALHAAAYVENEELVRLLLDKGAIWNAGE